MNLWLAANLEHWRPQPNKYIQEVSNMNGLRIEIKGALGSGKSTVAALITEVLEDIGFNVVCEDLGCVNLRKEKKLGEMIEALRKEHFPQNRFKIRVDTITAPNSEYLVW
jgi:adenylylsulfate kinase-like enzyme